MVGFADNFILRVVGLTVNLTSWVVGVKKKKCRQILCPTNTPSPPSPNTIFALDPSNSIIKWLWCISIFLISLQKHVLGTHLEVQLLYLVTSNEYLQLVLTEEKAEYLSRYPSSLELCLVARVVRNF